jgi:hypothetical protein
VRVRAWIWVLSSPQGTMARSGGFRVKPATVAHLGRRTTDLSTVSTNPGHVKPIRTPTTPARPSTGPRPGARPSTTSTTASRLAALPAASW